MRFAEHELTQAAMRYWSRAEWSVKDPATYDQAIMTLPDEKFATITNHMYDQNGLVLKGDPGDTVLISLRRQLAKARKLYHLMPGTALSEQCALLQFRINSRCKC